MVQRPPKPPGIPSQPRYRKSRSSDVVTQAARSFQELFHARHVEEDRPRILAELEGTSDRAACIIVSSMVERDLERALIRRLSMGFKLHKPRVDKLFERDGALSSFAGEINLIYALNIIESITKHDLDTVRRIRNIFAHSAIPISFTDREVANEIQKLQPGSYYGLEFEDLNLEKLSPNRRYFIFSCFRLLVDLEIAYIAATRAAKAKKQLYALFITSARGVTGIGYRTVEGFNDHDATDHTLVLTILHDVRRRILVGDIPPLVTSRVSFLQRIVTALAAMPAEI